MNRTEKKSKEAKKHVVRYITMRQIYSYTSGKEEMKSIEHDDLKKMRDLNKIKKDSNAIIENNL